MFMNRDAASGRCRRKNEASVEIAAERGVIEAAIFGCDRDCLRVGEGHQAFEFGFAKGRQRHDRYRADVETRERQRGELDAIWELNDDAIAGLEPIAREEGGDASCFS